MPIAPIDSARTRLSGRASLSGGMKGGLSSLRDAAAGAGSAGRDRRGHFPRRVHRLGLDAALDRRP